MVVIDSESMVQLRKELRDRMAEDRKLLEDLRAEVRSGLGHAHRIMPRQTTAVSLVGTDGGNNRIEFDPFMAQLIRVVDSSNNEYCLEVVTPTTNLVTLSKRHLEDGNAKTPLGKMMKFLGVTFLWELSPTIKKPPATPSPSWVQVYRELTEWAVLFSLVREKDYGTDTVIVWDGLLRSKVFSTTLFADLRKGIEQALRAQKAKRRNIYVVGVAKHSKVLQRYRLAMMLESTMRTDYPCYADVSRELERKSYFWAEWARGSESESETGEINKFVAGKMFFVKFGGRPRDPIWPVDVLEMQVSDAQFIFGSLLADSIEGFPVPFYPRCLQRAHENAALVDFDMDILQQGIVNAIRDSLGESAPVLDELALIDADPAGKRYG